MEYIDAEENMAHCFRMVANTAAKMQTFNFVPEFSGHMF